MDFAELFKLRYFVPASLVKASVPRLSADLRSMVRSLSVSSESTT